MVFYLGRFAPALAGSGPWLVVPIVPGAITLTISPQTLTAIAIIAAMAWLHRRGLGPGRVVGNLLASLKVTAFALFIAVGFAWGSGTVAVVLIYVLMNALYLYVIPARELAAVNRSVLDIIADRLLGSSAGNIMGVVSIISLAASISAMTLAGPRVYYSMGRDGLFFRRTAIVHPRYRTPSSSIIAQAAWSSLLVLTATADALVTYTGFAIVLFSGMAVIALFVS